MAIRIIRTPITRAELVEIAAEGFGDVVKAVVDVRQGIMAVGGELHADEEVLLTEEEGSLREDTWGVNLYPKQEGDWIEFDSMINLKPSFGNRSRGVENSATREKIIAIVQKFVLS
jgi:hypothetical protein